MLNLHSRLVLFSGHMHVVSVPPWLQTTIISHMCYGSILAVLEYATLISNRSLLSVSKLARSAINNYTLQMTNRNAFNRCFGRFALYKLVFSYQQIYLHASRSSAFITTFTSSVCILEPTFYFQFPVGQC